MNNFWLEYDVITRPVIKPSVSVPKDLLQAAIDKIENVTSILVTRDGPGRYTSTVHLHEIVGYVEKLFWVGDVVHAQMRWHQSPLAEETKPLVQTGELVFVLVGSGVCQTGDTRLQYFNFHKIALMDPKVVGYV
jgi:hypothetical protein